MKTPSDNFLAIDKAVRQFKSKRTSLYWKVDAIHTLFECSREIMTNNYHNELQRIATPLVPASQRKLCHATLQVIAILHQYRQKALFFEETFAALSAEYHALKNSNKRNTAALLDTTIVANRDLMHVLDLLETPTTLLKKYPFKMMVILGKRFRKKHPLFLAATGISTTDHLMRL